MKKMKLVAALALACSSALAISVAQAGTIIDLGTVIQNSMGEYGNGIGAISNLSNHSYLSSDFTSGVTDYDSYVSSGVTHTQSDLTGWLSSIRVYSGTLTFDLGAEYNLSKMAMWNSASGLSASVNQFSVYTSDDSTFATSTFVGSFAGQQANTAANSYVLTDSTARYVRLNVANNFGNYCCTEIGFVGFDAVAAAVPEPTTTAILGIGMLGFAVSRRKAVMKPNA